MQGIRLRQVRKRDYRDPVSFLKRLRRIELILLSMKIDPRIRALRTNKLKEFREARLGALFCQGISERTGRKIFFSKAEFEDADFVATWVKGDTQVFAPVQIKELVPEQWNPNDTLEKLIRELSTYSGKKDLTVLIHLNRQTHFDPSSIVLPKQLPIAALWVLACLNPAQSEWGIWGDFLEQAEGTKFAYPG